MSELSEPPPLSSYAFLGFGHGPRGCLGRRFAMYAMRLALAAVLSKHRLVRTSNTPTAITFDPSHITSHCLEHLLIKVEKR